MKSLESTLNLTLKEHEILTSQAKSATSLLEGLKSQQESASRQAAEYSALFLAKQEAYTKLMREFVALQQEKEGKRKENSPVKQLQEEVRRRLTERLTRM